MPLRIANTRTDRIAVDLLGATPNAVRDLSLDGVRRRHVAHGNSQVELSELFRIDGNGSDGRWDLVGDFSAVHGLGAGMTGGEIIVDGPVGRHAGAGMRGGRIEVRGAAGDWLGAEMHGGAIRIRGDAGDHVGSGFLGSRRGMSGGTILIDGNAGAELGAAMRRGLIAVAGSVGPWVGARMLAGSIFVFGDSGPRPGAGMKRGTIALFGGSRPQLLPTFRSACRGPLTMLRLLERRLRAEQFAPSRLAAMLDDIELFNGDLLQSGRGEILLPARD